MKRSLQRLAPISMVALAFCAAGCRQEMARQPAYRPLRASSFFEDGRSVRPLVPGTVARGTQVASGKKPMVTSDWLRVAGLVAVLPAHPLNAASAMADWSPYMDAFPMPLSQEVLARGQERFNIYCAMCHDRLGNGNGMIVQRGFTAPPSFHSDLSRGFKLRGAELKLTEAPVGYFFEVITHGFGAMPDYASQIVPDDRWAIIAYIRALQLSQHATLADVRDENETRRLLSLRGSQR